MNTLSPKNWISSKNAIRGFKLKNQYRGTDCVHRGEDMYEVGGFIVHFFSKEKVEHLAKGYELLGVDTFEEGGLPRNLFRVALRKQGEKQRTKGSKK